MATIPDGTKYIKYAVYHYHANKIVCSKVVHETRTMVVGSCNVKFRKSDGRAIGSGRGKWSIGVEISKASPATEADLSEYNSMVRINRMRDYLRRKTRWEDIEDAAVEEIYKCVRRSQNAAMEKP